MLARSAWTTHRGCGNKVSLEHPSVWGGPTQCRSDWVWRSGPGKWLRSPVRKYRERTRRASLSLIVDASDIVQFSNSCGIVRTGRSGYSAQSLYLKMSRSHPARVIANRCGGARRRKAAGSSPNTSDGAFCSSGLKQGPPSAPPPHAGPGDSHTQPPTIEGTLLLVAVGPEPCARRLRTEVWGLRMLALLGQLG